MRKIAIPTTETRNKCTVEIAQAMPCRTEVNKMPGEEIIDDHFGHCDHYTVFTIDGDDNIVSIERLDSPQGCGCKSNIASVMQNMGITIMLAGNMGMGAFNKLTMHGIRVVRGCQGKIEDVLKAYLNGTIKDSEESCSHHDCGEQEEKPMFIIPNI